MIEEQSEWVFPYQVDLPNRNEQFHEILHWCLEQFGPFSLQGYLLTSDAPEVPDGRWSSLNFDRGPYCFLHYDDALKFFLGWG
jgi:hypothetical protein